MNHLKLNFKFVFLSILLCLLNSCSKTEAPPQDRVISQIDPKAINIGYVHGAAVRLRNSAALAVKHINDSGGILGKNFNIVYNLAENTETAVEKSIVMMDDYNLQALISSTSSRTIAISDESIKRHVVVISDTATSPLLTSLDDNDFVFRTAPSDIHQGKVMAQLAFSNGGEKAVFIHNEGDIYGSSLAEEFKNELLLLGGTNPQIITIPDAVTVGFDSYMPQVFDSNPDVIILALVRSAVNSNFINETQNQTFNGFYLFPDVSTNSTFVSNLADPSIIKQAFGVTPSLGLNGSAHLNYFSQSYLTEFNIEIQNFNTNTYDAVILLALAIEHAGLRYNSDNPTGLMIKESLREIMNPPGTNVGPANISQALSLLRNNQAINYHGAYSNNDFDQAGDISGTIVYDTFSFDNINAEFDLIEQIIIEVPTQ